MKDWLIQKEAEQNKLFNELCSMTIKVIDEYNKKNGKNYYFQIGFRKDEWLSDGVVEMKIIDKNDSKADEAYGHYVGNKEEDISSKVIKDLMKQGVFTNTWFSILDRSRYYDVEFFITDKGIKIFNEEADCEYLEERAKKNRSGFNLDSEKKKLKR